MTVAKRIGVIGGGQVYRRLYAPALRYAPTLSVVSVGDPARDSGAKYARTEDMLSSETLDGVIVLSPPALHAEHVSSACERSLPVLVEKPAALRVAEVDAWPNSELVTPAFSRRYWRRYREPAGGGHRWRFHLQTDPAAWGAAAPEPVERDLLPHAADLATWLSGERIDSIACARTSNGATGSFGLSEGGTFEWVVEHGNAYLETLEYDGRPYRPGGAIAERVLNRVFRRPAEDVGAIGVMLREWAELLNGSLRGSLGTVEDARTCARVIEAAELQLKSSER